MLSKVASSIGQVTNESPNLME